MRDNPINALRETLRCGFAFRKSRLESLCVLVFGVFVARTVNLSEPPQVYRRAFGSNIRLLFHVRSRFHRTSPLLRAA